VLVPGFIINRIVHFSALVTQTRFGAAGKMYIPVAMGLCSIPFIVKPIDHGTDLFMDVTYRRIF